MDITRIAATGWSPRFMPEDAYRDYAAWLAEHPTALDQ
jgi:nucleoside-diphosphate-sugar epimerase